jgi:cyclopropane fatty-acyl-phospholipid synthase-like methyltransferase
MKPFSEACEENKGPILAVLERLFVETHGVLEIGSGTGQHAVWLAAALPHLTWQTSDRSENHPGIRAWLDEAGLPNVLPPIELDVAGAWPEGRFDAVFSANTTHIMSWPEVELMFEGIGRVLEEGGCLALYGPFNFGGNYTSESNARFDQWLKNRDPHSGIRHFEDLDALARSHGLSFVEDIPMPVNNRTLVWRRD